MREERLQAVPLFSGLDDDDLERICRGVEEVKLSDGEVLFREGEAGDRAYVIDDGELEIIKTTGNRRRRVAVRQAGDVIGEMALLQEAPRNATLKAVGDTVLIGIPKATLDELIETSPHAAAVLYKVVLDRWKENSEALKQAERLATLGRITAELTHNLNNPAAAVRRASTELRSLLVELIRIRTDLEDLVPDDERRGEVRRLLAAAARGEVAPDLDPLTRSDREGEIEDWLDEVGVAGGWEVAPALVELGLGVDDLGRIRERFGGLFEQVVRGIATTHSALALLSEVEQGSAAISEIVAAMKRSTHLDQAPVQRIDLAQDIDAVITLMRGKAKQIEIRREIDPALPEIEAYGRELSDALMNLVDNAIDAISGSGRPDGRIVVRARPEGDMVVVEVEDDGPGIPPDHLPRIFELFYTTKPQGEGTGIGLHSVQATVREHGGDVDVESRPGRTLFRIELPLQLPPGP